jgi:hypothetical protein
VTIQDLLTREGRWPDISGPKRNVTAEINFRFNCDDIPRDAWVKMSQKRGKYTFSTWFYMPTDTAYIDGTMLIDRGTA